MSDKILESIVLIQKKHAKSATIFNIGKEVSEAVERKIRDQSFEVEPSTIAKYSAAGYETAAKFLARKHKLTNEELAERLIRWAYGRDKYVNESDYFSGRPDRGANFNNLTKLLKLAASRLNGQ